MTAHAAQETALKDLITAGGWRPMPSEIDKALDMANSAPEFYLVLGMRDFTHHTTTVRETYERVKNKGCRVIYREFEELGERSYHPTCNDDALWWAALLRGGMGNLRTDPELSARWSKFLMWHPEYSPVPGPVIEL
jgi:hypothetical protein